MNKALLCLATILVTALFCRSQQRAAPGLTPVQENVSYGPGLLLDVYPPANAVAGLHAAIILIHGGSWSSLDKSTMRTMAGFLARHGYVGFAVDYRLYQDGKNRWPAQLDDVQRAVRWVRANAAKYAVDPQRIGSFGHSAGAQLALLLGLEDTRDNSEPALSAYSSRVQAVVDVSGPTDFTKDHDADGDAFLTHFLGGSYSKRPDLWRDASPVFHVAKGDPPFLIMHGTRDQEVAIAQSEELADKLQSAGGTVAFIKVDDVHTFQTQEARHELAIQTLAFFDRYLGSLSMLSHPPAPPSSPR
jgi:acetyl esterase/lipase